jgi:hypothetical protein
MPSQNRSHIDGCGHQRQRGCCLASHPDESHYSCAATRALRPADYDLSVYGEYEKKTLSDQLCCIKAHSILLQLLRFHQLNSEIAAWNIFLKKRVRLLAYYRKRDEPHRHNEEIEAVVPAPQQRQDVIRTTGDEVMHSLLVSHVVELGLVTVLLTYNLDSDKLGGLFVSCEIYTTSTTSSKQFQDVKVMQRTIRGRQTWKIQRWRRAIAFIGRPTRRNMSVNVLRIARERQPPT